MRELKNGLRRHDALLFRCVIRYGKLCCCSTFVGYWDRCFVRVRLWERLLFRNSCAIDAVVDGAINSVQSFVAC
jgi:hypothetical protein